MTLGFFLYTIVWQLKIWSILWNMTSDYSIKEKLLVNFDMLTYLLNSATKEIWSCHWVNKPWYIKYVSLTNKKFLFYVEFMTQIKQYYLSSLVKYTEISFYFLCVNEGCDATQGSCDVREACGCVLNHWLWEIIRSRGVWLSVAHKSMCIHYCLLIRSKNGTSSVHKSLW